MESCPALAGKARKFGAEYRRLAIVELLPGFEGTPKMISVRARGVKRIVREAVTHVGKSDRSSGYRLRADMMAWVARQNRLAENKARAIAAQEAHRARIALDSQEQEESAHE
jgi:hypothetical protein